MIRSLVVDDELPIRQLVSTLLKSAGHEVALAASGREALAALDAGPRRDLLVIDIGLGDMSGLDVVRASRRKDPDLKILVVSGYMGLDSVELRRALRNEGVVYTLPKPFAAQELLRTVREMFMEELPTA
jgi:two-component system response regulator PilR (NtrC family)